MRFAISRIVKDGFIGSAGIIVFMIVIAWAIWKGPR